MTRCSIISAPTILTIVALGVAVVPISGAWAQAKNLMQVSPVTPCSDTFRDRRHAQEIVKSCDAIALDREQPVPNRLKAMKTRLQVSREANVWFFQKSDIQFIEAYAELEPDNIPVKLMIAQQRLNDIRNAEAIKIATGVLEQDAENGIARLIRGVARFHKNSTYSDLTDLSEAIRLLPRRPEPLMHLGRALEHRGQFDAAARLYARALPLKKTEAIFYSAVYSPAESPEPALGRVLLKLDEPDVAISIMTDVLADMPNGGSWRNQMLGFRLEAYLRTGDLVNAITDLNEIMGTVQEHEKPDFLMRRAFFRMKLKQFDQAMADIAQATASGSLKMILQLQVKLRNAGQTNVEINGKFDAPTKAGLLDCMSNEACGARLGTPI